MSISSDFLFTVFIMRQGRLLVAVQNRGFRVSVGLALAGTRQSTGNSTQWSLELLHDRHTDRCADNLFYLGWSEHIQRSPSRVRYQWQGSVIDRIRSAVAAISSKPWGTTWRARSASLYRGSRGRAPSGVQGQSPWSGDQGAKPPEAERKLNVDNTITRLILH